MVTIGWNLLCSGRNDLAESWGVSSLKQNGQHG